MSEGEPHYWAVLADRQRELRCTGQSDHADASLRQMAKDGGLGFSDGVLAKLDAGYIKEELPDQLQKVWTEEPHRVDRAGALWKDGVSGPARGPARKVATQALEAAMASSDRPWSTPRWSRTRSRRTRSRSRRRRPA